MDILRHERAIDTIIESELGLARTGEPVGRMRLDFFCVADSRHVVVVEIKRPGHTATLEEWRRFETYVATLRQHYGRLTNEADRRDVTGLFVATRLEPLAQQVADDARGAGILRFTDWHALLTRAQREYRAYFETLLSKTGPADPRRRVLRLLVPLE